MMLLSCRLWLVLKERFLLRSLIYYRLESPFYFVVGVKVQKLFVTIRSVWFRIREIMQVWWIISGFSLKWRKRNTPKHRSSSVSQT